MLSILIISLNIHFWLIIISFFFFNRDCHSGKRVSGEQVHNLQTDLLVELVNSPLHNQADNASTSFDIEAGGILKPERSAQMKQVLLMLIMKLKLPLLRLEPESNSLLR